MKRNTEKLKNYLILAIQNTPQDFVFENIKPLLKSALSIVEKVEKKRENREIQNQRAINSYNFNAQQYNNTLRELDKMIKEQEKTLESLKNKNNNDSSSSGGHEVLND